MAYFLFDVLNTTGYVWGEERVECAGREEVEAHARDLLTIGQPYHDGGMYLVTVTVLNASFALVLTAIADPDGVSLLWNWPT